MNDQPLDPWKQKLIALLYGELSADEEKEVRAKIESDSALRIEWDELQSTRERLAGWELTEDVPSFVFVDDSPEIAKTSRRLGGWRRRLGGFVTATPWAVAAAAVLVALLAINDFRIEKKNGSYALRFGQPATTSLVDASSLPELGSEGGETLEGRPESQSSNGINAVADMLAAPGMSPFVTREEFEAYTVGMMQTMVVLLNQYGQERDGEVATLLNAAFSDFVRMQNEEYLELRNRIEVAEVGMAEKQLRTNVQVDYLMQQNQPGLMAPVSHSPADGPEGVEK